MESQKKEPEKKFSTGAISATIWRNVGQSRNTGEPIEYRTIQVDRRYTDKEGNWKSTNSFRVNDLPKLQVVLSEAFKYVVLKTGSIKEGSGVSTTETSSDFETDFEDIVVG